MKKFDEIISFEEYIKLHYFSVPIQYIKRKKSGTLEKDLNKLKINYDDDIEREILTKLHNIELYDAFIGKTHETGLGIVYVESIFENRIFFNALRGFSKGVQYDWVPFDKWIGETRPLNKKIWEVPEYLWSSTTCIRH